jgi:zinc transport system substrate-binding protein
MRAIAICAALSATPALAEVPRVVTDFGPVQSLVAEVMGELGAPQMLLPPGADPHDFQLRPSQAQALSQADLVFWVGPELMHDLGQTLATLAPQARIVPLLSEGGTAARTFAEGGQDPHAWLDPDNGIAWARHIAQVLGQADPAHAATYAANAATLTRALGALDLALAAQLAPVKDRPFVTYHDALGHFTDHYGLALAGAIELGDATTPSAAQLDTLRGVLQGASALCVFPEAGRDPKYIAALTDGLPVKLGAAQDLEFFALPAGRGQYAVLLQAIAATLVDCLAP